MNYYTVGKIVKTQGLRGEVRVNPMTDFAESRFRTGSVLVIFDSTDKLIEEVSIMSAKSVKNVWHLKFKGYNNINDVEKFIGMTLKISEDKQEPLPQGEFYFHEIIGCEVYDGAQKIGVVTEILQPGANDVWVVTREGKKDLLVPYINSVIVNINPVEKKIQVEIPEGLDD